LFDYAYCDLHLEGSALTPAGVNAIIQGEIAPEVSLGEHNEVERHRRLLRLFQDLAHLDLEPNRAVLSKIYETVARDAILDPLASGVGSGYRKGSPVLFHLDYTPPPYAVIPELLDAMFREAYRMQGDFIERAVACHNGIIAIYPYRERSEILARAVFQYEMIRNGLFIIPFEMSEQAYNGMVAEALKDRESGLTAALTASAAKKMMRIEALT
jgi:Fic family protein